MGWETLSDGVRYYSISEEIGIFHNRILDFLMNISAGTYTLLILSVIGVFVMLMIMSIAFILRRIGDIS